ncbi:ABC transporter permease [Pontibacter liquoris]|uniref:ABC transporter permease n=1 Tax=Pontibacter liquoris TaxID=2905677 RepID=UPI001FA6B253|nr:ABC transporter permease [Pontibacter liquoris]
MKQMLHDMHHLWQTKLSFKMAASFLLLLLLLVLILPWLPLPFAPNHLDLDHLFSPPFPGANTSEATHWLGTDVLGRDVLTEMLYGARTGLFISIPVVVLATAIGLVLGAAAGFYGDTRLKTSRATLLLLPLLLSLLFYLGIYLPLQIRKYELDRNDIVLCWAMLLVITSVMLLGLRPLLQKVSWFSHKKTFPLDMVVMRLIEIVSSVPWLILVLVLASFMPSSVMLLSTILILTYWTTTARLARAEMLRIKAMPYMEAGYSMGFTKARLLLKEALPNLLGPVLIAVSYGIAGLLTLESTLSFLSIGLPPTVVSWGRTITGIRSNTAAWWLVAFPGGFLALTVLALQIFSYSLQSILRKKKL